MSKVDKIIAYIQAGWPLKSSEPADKSEITIETLVKELKKLLNIRKLSESSYAFSIVHRLLTEDRTEVSSAPIIPSLRREYNVGYDATLYHNNKPLSLQFKIPDFLCGYNACEYSHHKSNYYRITINDHQRKMMKQRAIYKGRLAFYVAPMFHCERDFQKAFQCGNILDRSIWIPMENLSRHSNHTMRCVTFTGTKQISIHYGECKSKRVKTLSCHFSWKEAKRKIQSFQPS